MGRFTKPVPFSIEPRRHKQEDKDSNPVRRLWRPRALPGAHSCTGCLGGIEPTASTFTGSCAKPLHHRHHLSIGPEGIEPSSGPYKEPALTVELRAGMPVGPEGFEPPPYRLKGGYAAITPRPRKSSRTYGFQRVSTYHDLLLLLPNSPGRNRTSHRRRIRSPCSCYTTGPLAARSGVEPLSPA